VNEYGALLELYLRRKTGVLKTGTCVTLSTTNPTWTGLGVKTSLRGEKPETHFKH